MAASRPPERPSNEPLSVDDNPFVAFRKYADAQISTMLQGFGGFPSAVDGQTWSPGWAPSWVHEAEERIRRAEAARQGDRDNVSSTEQQDMSHRWWRPCHRPRDADGSALPLEGEHTSGQLRRGHRTDPSTRLADFVMHDWLIHSAHSPLFLEQCRNLALAEPGGDPLFWRRAFEDLLQHTAGSFDQVPSAATSRCGRYWAWNVSEAWAGMLPDQQQRSYQHEWRLDAADSKLRPRWWSVCRTETRNSEPARAPSEEERSRTQQSGEPDTELDMYDRFLEQQRAGPSEDALQSQNEGVESGDVRREQPDARSGNDTAVENHRSVSTSNSHSPWEALMVRQKQNTSTNAADHVSSDSANSSFKNDGVVATLTTTEHVVLPDGSTRTTVSLRRRFEDGREERKETVHTNRGSEDGTSDVNRSIGSWDDSQARKGGEAMSDASAAGTKKKGWFWS